jgi:hypothetical protein
MKIVALVVALAVLVPAPALACWDGTLAQSEGFFWSDGDMEWSVERARELGTWMRRFDALLGPGGNVEAEFGGGTVCMGERCVEVETRSPNVQLFFQRAATALGVTWRARAAALAVTATPHAVQVAASRDRAQAQALANRVSDLDLPMGFYEVGGFPSDNAEAHVVESVDAEGRPVFRIFVGTFLDREGALAAAPEIAQATGLPTLVRAL